LSEPRFGVIGIGYLGKFHAEKYAKIPGIRLTGVADTHEGRLAEVSGRLGVRAYRDHREMLGDVDAVSIAVPTAAHFKVAKDCLLAGKDVLIEKPMATSSREAAELNRIAARKKRLIQVGHLERFNPAMAGLRGQIGKPMFIEAHRLAPFVERGTDVDVVLDLMIHDIDLVLSMVKSEVRWVHAVGVPVITKRVDISNARIEFKNGCVANLTASRISRDQMRKIRIFHEGGYCSIDLGARQALVVKTEGVSESGAPNITGEAISCEAGDALFDELVSFVECVLSRKRPVVSGLDGQRAIAVAEKIIRKM
jgi:predicted dehydrogenase